MQILTLRSPTLKQTFEAIVLLLVMRVEDCAPKRQYHFERVTYLTQMVQSSV